MSDGVQLSRRTWIALAAAGGTGAALGLKFLIDAPEATTAPSPATDRAPVNQLAVWVRIATDGRIEVTVPKAEVGQGVFTTCAAIVAEEMGADLARVVPALAGANPAYDDPRIGHQTTGRSASMENMYLRLRIVGDGPHEQLMNIPGYAALVRAYEAVNQ